LFDGFVSVAISMAYGNIRNLLKGQVGDEINVLMAACAWNLRKWLVIDTIFLFWQKLGLFFVIW
jgi:IS5 family transposase